MQHISNRLPKIYFTQFPIILLYQTETAPTGTPPSRAIGICRGGGLHCCLGGGLGTTVGYTAYNRELDSYRRPPKSERDVYRVQHTFNTAAVDGAKEDGEFIPSIYSTISRSLRPPVNRHKMAVIFPPNCHQITVNLSQIRHERVLIFLYHWWTEASIFN